MTTLENTIRIEATPDKVWAILANLGEVVNFNPIVTESYYTSDRREGVGASRYCRVLPALDLNETVIDWRNGQGFTVAGDISGDMAPPVENMRGRYILKEDGAGTQVIFQINFDPFPEIHNVEEIVAQISMQASMVLAGLKHHAETGEAVDMKVLKRIEHQPVYSG